MLNHLVQGILYNAFRSPMDQYGDQFANNRVGNNGFDRQPVALVEMGHCRSVQARQNIDYFFQVFFGYVSV